MILGIYCYSTSVIGTTCSEFEGTVSVSDAEKMSLKVPFIFLLYATALPAFKGILVNLHYDPRKLACVKPRFADEKIGPQRLLLKFREEVRGVRLETQLCLGQRPSLLTSSA